MNRKAIGFWVEANSAQEAEQKFVEFAGQGMSSEIRAKYDEAELAKQKAEVERLKEEIRKMKTEAPEPEQFKSRRLFRRW